MAHRPPEAGKRPPATRADLHLHELVMDPTHPDALANFIGSHIQFILELSEPRGSKAGQTALIDVCETWREIMWSRRIWTGEIPTSHGENRKPKRLGLYNDSREAPGWWTNEDPILGLHQMQVSLEYRLRLPVAFIAPPPNLKPAPSEVKQPIAVIWEMDLSSALLVKPPPPGDVVYSRTECQGWQCPICEDDVDRPNFPALKKHFIIRHPSFILRDLGEKEDGKRHVRLTPQHNGLSRILGVGRQRKAAQMARAQEAAREQKKRDQEAAARIAEIQAQEVRRRAEEEAEEAEARRRAEEEVVRAEKRRNEEAAARIAEMQAQAIRRRLEEEAAARRLMEQQAKEAEAEAQRQAEELARRRQREEEEWERIRVEQEIERERVAEEAERKRREEEVERRRQVEEDRRKQREEEAECKRRDEEDVHWLAEKQYSRLYHQSTASQDPRRETPSNRTSEAAYRSTSATDGVTASQSVPGSAQHRAVELARTPLALPPTRTDVDAQNAQRVNVEDDVVPCTPPPRRISGEGSQRDPLLIEDDDVIITTRVEYHVNGSSQGSSHSQGRPNGTGPFTTPSKGSQLDPITLEDDDLARLPKYVSDADSDIEVLPHAIVGPRASASRRPDSAVREQAGTTLTQVSEPNEEVTAVTIQPNADASPSADHSNSSGDSTRAAGQNDTRLPTRTNSRVQQGTLACALDEIDAIWDGGDRMHEIRAHDEVRPPHEWMTIRRLTFALSSCGTGTTCRKSSVS